MFEIQKGNLTIDGVELHVSMPFEKVNKENRTVSGWATLDNEDTQGDIVTAEASARAFGKARGNLREMHKKDSAVGRVVSFKEAELFHNGETYKGIFVTARVSKGAQDAWEKVLDGTYSGFSIGGSINKVANEINKSTGKSVQKVLDFDLTELSLVDNPANQLANIKEIHKVFEITKSADGAVVVTGDVADTIIESVYVCPNDNMIVVTDKDAAECPLCDAQMTDAGWFESTGEARAQKITDIVNNFQKSAEVTPNQDGGVDELGDKTEEVAPPQEQPAEQNAETTATIADAAVVETEPESTDVEEVSEEPVAEPVATDVTETSDETEEIAKQIDELKVAVENTLKKSADRTDEAVKVLEKKIDEIHDTFNKKASELEEKFSSLGEELSVQKSRLADAEHRMEKINSSDALRKSADVEEIFAEKKQDKTEKWGRAFSGDLF